MTDVTYVPFCPRVTYGCYLARSLLVYGPYQLPVTWYLLVEMYLLVLLPSYLCPSPYYERSAGRSALLRVARLTGNLLFYKYLGSFEARRCGALLALPWLLPQPL